MKLPFNADRPTLFFDAAASRAVLVTSERGRYRKTARQFSDAIAALRWCITHRAHFVLFWPSVAEGN